MAQDIINIRRPFDAHVHGRDGDLLRAVAPMTARQCWGAIFEPNLEPPITTPEQARAYRAEILEACRDYPNFKPFVLAYLTDTLDPATLSAGLESGDFIGAKFYPKGATTNSEKGILDVSTLWKPGTQQYDCIRTLTDHERVVQLHCELNYDLEGYELDPYDKEPYFFAEVLPRLIDAHPNAQLSCEHLTCAEGAGFMRQNGSERLGCSITAHHLLHVRADMFRNGLRPDLFCLPVIKRPEHRDALLELVSLGHPFVYAGTDSAPHDRRKKECDCCSGGIFTAHAAVELYAQAFDSIDVLDERFELFMSLNGPAFYGLPASDERIELRREPWKVTELINYSENPLDEIRPHGFETKPEERKPIEWRLVA